MDMYDFGITYTLKRINKIANFLPNAPCFMSSQPKYQSTYISTIITSYE